MPENHSALSYHYALEDFQRARQQATLEELLGALRGEKHGLLSFDEIRQKLRATAGSDLGLREIPLDAIVGSVGRSQDFTRSFLPKNTVDKTRWARIALETESATGLPPIEVYQLGEVYFVKDGNHRVSVARQMGARTIQAYVTEVVSKVPLSPTDTPDALIIKAEYADFLEKTQLDQTEPHADLSVSEAGKYAQLLEHIQVHAYYLGLEQQRNVPLSEAAVSWYHKVYLPVIEITRQRGILHDFPNRTETDLYLWLAEYRAQLEESLGWKLAPQEAATALRERFGVSTQQFFTRWQKTLTDRLLPDELESGPPPGQWRRERSHIESSSLFEALLVAVQGDADAWGALDLALWIAARENSILRGLHVIAAHQSATDPECAAVRAEFERRCAAAGRADGQIIFEQGFVQRVVVQRAYWSDLVILRMRYPPQPRFWARLSSGLRMVIRRSPRPLLAVPGEARPPQRVLLAYDNSPKAREALYVAAYIAAKWAVGLHVVSVGVAARQINAPPLLHARRYLESRGISAEYTQQSGRPGAVILEAARQTQSDWVIMGGYTRHPLHDLVFGSVLEQVLRGATIPVLICR
ncbi:MAG: universal stress protein [Anaerolineales bacterium]